MKGNIAPARDGLQLVAGTVILLAAIAVFAILLGLVVGPDNAGPYVAQTLIG